MTNDGHPSMRALNLGHIAGVILLAGLCLIVAPLADAQALPPASTSTPSAAPLSRADLQKALTVPSDPASQLRLVALLARQPESDNDIILPWFQKNSDVLPPIFLALLARRLFDRSPADALEWFAVSYARALYDAQRCSDPTAGADFGLPLLAVAGRPLISYRLSHSDENAAAEQRALARKDLFSDKVSPMWICVHGMALMQQQLGGQAAPPPIKPADQWPPLQQHVRDAMIADINKAFAVQASRKALPTGTLELRVPHPGVPFAVAWSPDGKQLATTLNGDPHIVIWDTRTGTLLKEMDRGTAIADAIAFTEGGYLITSAASGAPNTAVVSQFDAGGGAALRQFTQVASNTALAFDGPRRLIAYLGKGTSLPRVILAKLDDPAATMPALAVDKDVPAALAFAPSGDLLAVGTLNGEILIFDVTSGALRQRIDAFDHGWIKALAFSPDGKRLALGVAGGLSAYRGADGQMRKVDNSKALQVRNAADGALLFACGDSENNIATQMQSIAWSADNRHLAVTSNDRVLLLDAVSPQHPKLLMQFDQKSAQFGSDALAFNPDGTRLAMTGDNIAFIVPIAATYTSAPASSTAACQ